MEGIIRALRAKPGLTEQFFDSVRKAAEDRGIAEDELVVDVLNVWAASEREYGGQVGKRIVNNAEVKTQQVKLFIDRDLHERIEYVAAQMKVSTPAFISDTLLMWSIGRFETDDKTVGNLPRGRRAIDTVIRRPTISSKIMDKIALAAEARHVGNAGMIRAIIEARLGLLDRQAERRSSWDAGGLAP